jgi:hypothetical protein
MNDEGIEVPVLIEPEPASWDGLPESYKRFLNDEWQDIAKETEQRSVVEEEASRASQWTLDSEAFKMIDSFLSKVAERFRD